MCVIPARVVSCVLRAFECPIEYSVGDSDSARLSVPSNTIVQRTIEDSCQTCSGHQQRQLLTFSSEMPLWVFDMYIVRQILSRNIRFFLSRGRRYFPTRLIALRTCKSSILAGVTQAAVDAAQALEPGIWCTSGNFGLILFNEPSPAGH